MPEVAAAKNPARANRCRKGGGARRYDERPATVTAVSAALDPATTPGMIVEATAPNRDGTVARTDVRHGQDRD